MSCLDPLGAIDLFTDVSSDLRSKYVAFHDFEDMLRTAALQEATNQNDIDAINDLFDSYDLGKSLYLEKSASDWGSTILQAGLGVGAGHYSKLANGPQIMLPGDAPYYNEMTIALGGAAVAVGIHSAAADLDLNGATSEQAKVAAILGANLAIGKLLPPQIAVPLGFIITEAIDSGWSSIIDGFTNNDPIADITSSAVSAVTERMNDIALNGVDSVLIAGQELLENALCLARWAIPDPLENVLTKFGNAILNIISPIVIDLDGDGIELVSLEDSHAYFDLDLDGFAELTGWVTDDDGLLAIDANENGIIDDNSELFGNDTLDGFSVLAGYDSNEDGMIDGNDAVWTKLLVWADSHQDGVSRPDELASLDSLGITGISLASTLVSYELAGNPVTHESTVTTLTGTLDAVDVWFVHNNANTINAAEYLLDREALDLPTYQGMGNLLPLHGAASLDNNSSDPDSTISILNAISNATLSGIFTDDDTASDLIESLMYRWAGVDDVSSDARGPNIDARQLGFLEKLAGTDYTQQTSIGQSNPGAFAGLELQEAFYDAFNSIYAVIIAQAGGSALFDGYLLYSINTNEITGVAGIDRSSIDTLETLAGTMTNVDKFWQNIIRVIEYSVGVNNLSVGDQSYLDDAIFASDNSLSLSGIVASLAWDAPDGSTFNGTAGNDSLTGGIGYDTLNGNDGHDALEGGIGNDELNGGSGDDVLSGESGQDYLRGNGGNDEYHYDLGHGFDIIREEQTGTGHKDKIVFGAGIDIGDLTFTRVANTGLIIDIDTGTQTGQIIIENQFNYAAGGGHVEEIEFSDTSTYDLDGQNWTMHGTASADTLYGVVSGGLGADTIYGGAGNDTIYGNGPNETDYLANTLHGEDGNDQLNGSAGVDTLYGGNGNDTLDGGADADHLDGGAGDDELRGGLGDDTYVFVSGNDVISSETGGTEELHLDAAWNGITPQYLKFGNDLQVWFDADNSIYITNHYLSGSVESMVYANTTTVDLTTVSTATMGDETNNTLYGTSNSDTLYGLGGNDTLNGNAGNDYLYGGSGDDYLSASSGDDYLSAGTGDDTVLGSSGDDHFFYTSGLDSYTENTNDTADIVELSASYGLDDIEIYRDISVNANHLIIAINAANQITLQGQFSAANRFETLRIAGESDINLLTMDITTYGTASGQTISGVTQGAGANDTIYGYGGNDTLSGQGGNDTLYGGDGNDTLNGNAGSDHLYGEAGDDNLNGATDDDTYYWTADEGNDTATDTGGSDTIMVTGGLTIADISVANSGFDEAVITASGTTGQLIVNNLRNGNAANHVETISFEDGFTTSLPDYASWLVGSSGNDLSAGNANDNTMSGGAGNDTMDGGAGNDDMHGGVGEDIIEGGDGDDLLHGGADDDLLYGQDGLDTLYGGAGADSFIFEAASAFNDVDVLKDFSVGQGDVIDISDVLDTYYTHGTDDIADFIQITDNGTDSTLSIDQNGGADNFVAVASILGVTGLTNVSALETAGVLVTH